MEASKTILYIDDEPLNRELFAINFGFYHNVISAESGAHGLELLQQYEIDIVISDFKMPGMDGVQFCRAAHAQNPEPKYFILSGFDVNYEVQKAISEKIIQKHFTKPMAVKDILAGINLDS